MYKGRLERMKNVLKIERSSNSHISFEELRKQEYHLEGEKDALYTMGNYRHNLDQTGWKQVARHIAAKLKRPVKGAPEEFAAHINNFKEDVSYKVTRMEMRLEYINKDNNV